MNDHRTLTDALRQAAIMLGVIYPDGTAEPLEGLRRGEEADAMRAALARIGGWQVNAPILSAEHRRILAGLAMDTGGFRVSNRQASDIAAACAAALKLAADAAELVDTAQFARVVLTANGGPTDSERRDAAERLRVALARMGEKA